MGEMQQLTPPLLTLPSSSYLAFEFQVHLLPAPSFILFAQLVGTVIVVKAAHAVGAIETLDKCVPPHSMPSARPSCDCQNAGWVSEFLWQPLL
jgi:hypothetical protein